MDGVFIMKLRILLWAILVFGVAFVLFAAENLLLQQEIADKTLRLHVVANSDSEQDQAHKLQVRDAVLEHVSQLTADCKDAKEAETVIAKNLESIADAAKSVSPYEISVSLGNESFDTRYYETFTLPAGEYTALRVNIGEAKGKNWWCVVFPSLCTAATSSSVEDKAQTVGFDDAQTDFITGGEERYTFRFKTLQWLRELRKLF